MAFNNSPVDPVPAVVGWPWHGLITAVNPYQGSLEPASLELGSGRVINDVRFGGNWTYLWDIGMPAPVVSPADPDEQWSNKAILRGKRTGAITIYGSKGYGSGPIKLGGRVGLSFFSWALSGYGGGTTPTSITLSVRVQSDHGDGVIEAVKSVTIPLGALDIEFDGEGPAPIRFIDVYLADKLQDGSGFMLCVMGGRGGATDTVGPLALVDLRVSGDITSIALATTVLATAQVTRGVVTRIQTPPPYPSGVVTIPSEPGATSRNTGKVGTWVTESRIDAAVWAWYTPDGTPDLVTLAVHEIATETITLTGTAADSTVAQTTSVTTTRSLSSTVGAVHTIAQADYSKSGTVIAKARPRELYSWTAAFSVDGIILLNQSGHGSDTTGGYFDYSLTHSSLAVEHDPMPDGHTVIYNLYFSPGDGLVFVGYHSLVEFSLWSNKVIGFTSVYRDTPYGVTQSRNISSSALTPSGVDPQAADWRTDATPPKLPGFYLAAYNPITGQAVRHRNTNPYTFV